MDKIEYWPSRECVGLIPELAKGFSRFLRSNVRLSSEPAEVPFKPKLLAIESGIARELDRVAYPFYNRTLAEFDADNAEARRRGWCWQMTNWVLAVPSKKEATALAAFPVQFVHSSTIGWDNESSANINSLFQAISTLRIYFHKGPVFAQNQWVNEGEWLWSELSAMESGLRGYEPPRDPWFTSKVCRTPIYGLKLPLRRLTAREKQSPVPEPPEIKKHGTIVNPNSGGLPIEWLDRIETLASLLEAALQANPEPEGKPAVTTPNTKPGPKTDDETDAACNEAVNAYRKHCRERGSRALKGGFADWLLESSYDTCQSGDTEEVFRRAKNYKARKKRNGGAIA